MLKKTAYWIGVVVIGIIFGLTLQFSKAWTEPTVAPPGGNLPMPSGGVTLGQGACYSAGMTSYCAAGYYSAGTVATAYVDHNVQGLNTLCCLASDNYCTFGSSYLLDGGTSQVVSACTGGATCSCQDESYYHLETCDTRGTATITTYTCDDRNLTASATTISCGEETPILCGPPFFMPSYF